MQGAFFLALLALAGAAGGAGPATETAAARADRGEAEVARRLEAGELAAALALYPAVVADRTAALAGRPLALADALEELAGRFYFAPGAAPEARQATESLLRRALELRRAVPGGGDLPAAETLENLSSLAYERGRWRQAEELEQAALAIFRRRLPAGHPRLVKSLGDLGRVYFQQGRYGQAEPLLADAVARLERADPPYPLAVAEASSALAELYRAQGRYAEAEARLKGGLALARRTGAAALLPEILGNLAGVYRDQGRFEEVEPLLAEALALRESRAGDDPKALAVTQLNQADIYRLQGRYDEAAELAAKALAGARRLLDPGDPDLAWYLEQEALVATGRGDYPKAAAAFGRALEVVESALPAGHPQIAQVLDDFGRMLRLSGRYPEAEEKYRRALSIRRAVYGERHPETASSLAQLARCRALSGDDGGALGLAEEALGTLAEASAYPDVEIDALALKAEVLKRRGETAPALAAMAAALEGVEELRPHTGGDEGLRAEFLSRYIGYANEMVAWQVEAGEPARAFETAERTRARVLLDQLAAGRVDLRRGIPPGVLAPLEKQEAELRARLAETEQRLARLPLEAELSAEQRRHEAAELERQAGRASRELQGLLERVRGASPLWREVITSSGRPVTVAAAQRELVREDGLLLLYQVGEAGSFLFVVPPPPEAIRAWPLAVSPAAAASLRIEAGPLTAGKLEEVLAAGRGDLAGILGSHGGSHGQGRSSRGALIRRLHALWQVLVPAELWPRLRRASEAVLVPDGALHRLPFEALVVQPAPDEVRYWLDEGPVVRYAPSATTLYNLRRREPARAAEAPSALVVADPDFERQPAVAGAVPAASPSLPRRRFAEAALGLPRLPGTAREGEAVRAALARRGGSVVSLSRADAGEARVRSELRRRPRFLHFATHALVDESHELLAALALAPPVDPARGPAPGLDDDGFLQLFEIYRLDLDSALVVLSACRTQVGRRLEGEGVFALSRGFLAAGAQRVVASLWPVNDDSTALLMADFYRRIGSGEEYAQALRDARRTLRRQPRWAEPYYWAPFVLSGVD